MQNTKTCFFYVLYSDKTWVFDQSEWAQGPIYIINTNITSFQKVWYASVRLLGLM